MEGRCSEDHLVNSLSMSSVVFFSAKIEKQRRVVMKNMDARCRLCVCVCMCSGGRGQCVCRGMSIRYGDQT